MVQWYTYLLDDANVEGRLGLLVGALDVLVALAVDLGIHLGVIVVWVLALQEVALAWGMPKQAAERGVAAIQQEIQKHPKIQYRKAKNILSSFFLGLWVHS